MEKGTGIKKHLPVILIVLMFLVGAGIFLYPNFSNWYYEKHQSEIIQEYGEVIEEISPEELEAEKEAVREFNRSLLNNQVVLTDPFDASQLDKNLGDYSEYLAQDEMMAYIDIPKIDVYLPIYHGTDKDTLEKGIGHLANTSFPMGGEGTHCVLSGHTGLPTALLFTNLDKMQKEDQFYIHVLDEVLAYETDLISIVEPDDISDLRIEADKDYVTLVTCTPYGQNTHRLLVRGHRIPYVEEDVKMVQEQKNQRRFWDKLVDFWKRRSLPIWVIIVVIASAILCVLLVSPLTFGRKKEENEEEKEEQIEKQKEKRKEKRKEKKHRAVVAERRKRREAAAARKREEAQERENLQELERLRKLKRLQELESLQKLEEPKKRKNVPKKKEKRVKEKVERQKKKRQIEKQQQLLARKERIEHQKEKLSNEKKQRQLGREERINRQKEKLLHEKKLRQLSSKERIHRQKEKRYEEKQQRERMRRRRLGRAYAKRRRRRRR